MNARERLMAQLRLLCAEPCPEDGQARRRKERRPPRDTQDLRLAGRVARSVALALGAGDDPTLNALVVLEGRPDPDAARVLVRVVLSGSRDPAELDAAHARLAAAGGWLRSAVAQDLARRQVPRLRFEVLPDEEGP